jgi:chromosome segregation ATPase
MTSPDYEELIGRLREPTGLDRPDLRAKLDEAAAALRQALAERDEARRQWKNYEAAASDVLARATTAEARIAELTPLVKQAFMDGLTYATNVEVTDTEEAWRTSRVRALANEAES